MATIELRQVEKKFGDKYAVKPVDLRINSGEFVVFLGPSGCGKTTTMRMISGLEAVTDGKIYLDGRDVTWLHPSERDIAFVFQFFALYPHMTARENIIFTLQAQGMDQEKIASRLRDVVKLLRIEKLLERRPGALSGGDKQRVALARALVRRPAAFLMDEPLGALDAEFRDAMRAEIKQLHLNQGATTVYVTHDQIEAMAMGDRIVVMSAAEVQQVGSPADVYYDPANLFVARFIGSPGMNLVNAHYTNGMIYLPGGASLPLGEALSHAVERELGSEGLIVAGFRPEAADISDTGSLVGEVYADDLHGAYTMLHVNLGEDQDIIHIRSDRAMSFPIGVPVRFDLKPEMVRLFNPQTEKAIRTEAA